MRPVIMRFGSMPMMWSSRRSGEKLRALLAGSAAVGGGTASAMLPVTPPLTRPAGDLSPGRGDTLADRPLALAVLDAHGRPTVARLRAGECGSGEAGQTSHGATAAAYAPHPPCGRPLPRERRQFARKRAPRQAGRVS